MAIDIVARLAAVPAATGTVTGTPTEQGTFTFSIIATDAATGAAKNGGSYNFSVSPAGSQ